MRTMYYRLKWWMISLMYKLGTYKDKPGPQLSITIRRDQDGNIIQRLQPEGYTKYNELPELKIVSLKDLRVYETKKEK